MKSMFRVKVILSVLITVAAVLFSGVTVFMFFEQSVTAAEQGTLRVAGWDVYADPKRQDKTIGYQSFEDKFGARIVFKPLHNLDEIVDAAELYNNDYDVFIVSNEGIQQLHGMGLVIPLDLKQMPRYQDLHHSLRFSEWSLFESRVYAVPWAWGPTGLLYNKDVLINPDSWNVLWDPKYRGRVSLWDDVSMIWTAALALGYRNVYNLRREQLENVKQKLFELNGQVHDYYEGKEQEMKFIFKDKVVALNSWHDPSVRLKAQGLNFKMVIPKEGAVGMIDSYLISKVAKNQTLAYEFINHQISPLIQQQMVRITGLAPSNIETLALLQPEEIRALHLNDPDYFNRMLLWDHMARKNLYEQVLETVRNDLKQKKLKSRGK